MQERKIDNDIAIITMTKEELAVFVHEAVRKALGDREMLDNICDYCTRHMASISAMRAPYRPANIEYKTTAQEDLPDWARLG
jgi:hypothetical protein